jgi:protoporphyrinogen oxidase
VSVAIVGGGLAGLVLAWRLMREGTDVIVLEASRTPGGVMRTLHRRDLVLEQGPHALPDTPLIRGLLAHLGLEAIEGTTAPAPHLWTGRTSAHLTVAGGLAAIPAALTAQLGERVRIEDPAVIMTATTTGWRVRTGRDQVEAKTAIVCCPPGPAARLLPELATELHTIRRQPITAIHLAWRGADAPEGPGRRGEGDVRGVFHVSTVFPHHAPDHVLVRVLLDTVGPDAQQLARAVEVMGPDRGAPAMSHIVATRHGRVLTAPDRPLPTPPRLHFVGASYSGGGAQAAIHSALTWGEDRSDALPPWFADPVIS